MYSNNATSAVREMLPSFVGAGNSTNIYHSSPNRNDTWNEKKRPDPIAQSADVIPNAVRDCWQDLGNSGIPESVFNSIVSTASFFKVRMPDRDISSNSIRGFIRLWVSAENAASPAVSFTPSGCITAEWFSGPESVLAILFTSDSRMVFNLFDAQGHTDGFESIEQIDNFVAMMSARENNPFEWSDANDEG